MIAKADLLDWLRGIDDRIIMRITLVAVGGTAMTLLGLKSSTIDIDFCLSSSDKDAFENALDNRFKVDIFTDGYIFSEQLPEDYVEKSKEILTLKNINLRALHPADIVITKAARLNARDEEDIRALARYVDKDMLMKRFEAVVDTYAGREEDYRRNFKYILRYLE
jgi:hypothetical protein